MRKTKNLLQEILIEAGSSSRDHILGGFPYTGNDLWTHLISSDNFTFSFSSGELVVKNHDQSPV